MTAWRDRWSDTKMFVGDLALAVEDLFGLAKHKALSLLDKLARLIAYAVPRRVVYWCAIRMLDHASGDGWDTPGYPRETNELLLRWNEKKTKVKVDA